MYKIKLSTNQGRANVLMFWLLFHQTWAECATANHACVVIKHNGVAGASGIGTEFKHTAYVR